MDFLVLRVILFSLFVAGCGNRESLTDVETPVSKSEQALARVRPAETTLKSGSPLEALSKSIDETATQRSSALQQLNAERAGLEAAHYLRYPKFEPSISVPLTGSSTVNAGLNLQQMLFDGGRSRAQISSAQLKVEDSLLAVWEERNQSVYEGLSAFADAVKYEERIQIGTRLLADLMEILEQSTARAESGVSDRGEVLRINGSINEVRRELLSDTSELARAQAELLQLFDKHYDRKGIGLNDLVGMCKRNWPETQAPRLDRIELRIVEAQISQRTTQARLLPKLVLQAGYTFDGTGQGAPTLGLRLDASDMLGLGRKHNIQAASALVTAAERTYQIERLDHERELAVLEQDYQGSSNELQQLHVLKENSRATIELFREQLDSGLISVVDGASFYRERAQIERSIMEARYSMLDNCLQSSRLRGTLAAFKEDYYD